MNNKKARVIAFYLPQFHPIPENDKWWGKGYTEWTNVGKARPLFKGHYQPKVPADLGYYDLRLEDVRVAQAEMAKDSGIEGFMYWHYWFGDGKTILDRPFKEVLESGKPDFPFCLGWANHSWTNHTWIPDDQYKTVSTLMEQKYPGERDYVNHFFHVLSAFKDNRYIQIDGKPLFYIHSPLDNNDIPKIISIWQNLAKENGLKGIYFIGQGSKISECKKFLDLGFNAATRNGITDVTNKINGRLYNSLFHRLRNYFRFAPLNKYKYLDFVNHSIEPLIDSIENFYPVIIPNFDHSPRSGRKGLILVDSTPDLFKKLIHNTLQVIQNKKFEHKVIFLRSWNEWAEGNYVEPDLKFNHGYLNALKEEILTSKL
jgi:hypothetical protein